MVQLFSADRNHKIRFIDKQYGSSKKRIIKVSNSIDSINVVSSMPQEMMDKQSITKVTIGSNVETIGMSSFCGCENLRDVKTGSNLKNIDDYAFMNCTSLTSIDVFGKGNKTKLYNIGVSAFANTGLKEVNIMLSGTSTDTQVNDYAFANNLELKKVKTIGSNYLASWEFRGCPSLTDIELANSHSFMGKGVFQDCTGLTNVKIPSNTFMIGEDMFKGCTSLAKVEFQEPGMFDRNKQIGNGFISDTNVTSITFPESVNSLDCLDDFCLMGAKNLKEIHFNGIAGTDLWIGDAQPQQQQPSGGQTQTNQAQPTTPAQTDNIIVSGTYKPGVIYYSDEATPQLFRTHIKLAGGTWDHNSVMKWETNGLKVFDYCDKFHIPIFVYWANSGCGACSSWEKASIMTNKFYDFMISPENKCVILFGYRTVGLGTAIKSLIQKTTKKQLNISISHYPYAMFYWNTGSEIKIRGCGRDFIDDYNRVRDKENGAQALIDMFKEWTSGYTCGLPEIPQNTSFAGESESGTNGMKYEFGKIYYTSDSVPKEVQKVNKEKTKKDQGAEITPIESYLKKLDGDEEDLITYCKTYRIPLVLYVTQNSCSKCTNYEKYVLLKESFLKDHFLTDKNKVVFLWAFFQNGSSQTYRTAGFNEAASLYKRVHGQRKEYTPFVVKYWNSPSGEKIETDFNSKPEEEIARYTNFTNSYNPQDSITLGAQIQQSATSGGEAVNMSGVEFNKWLYDWDDSNYMQQAEQAGTAKKISQTTFSTLFDWADQSGIPVIAVTCQNGSAPSEQICKEFASNEWKQMISGLGSKKYLFLIAITQTSGANGSYGGSSLSQKLISNVVNSTTYPAWGVYWNNGGDKHVKNCGTCKSVQSNGTQTFQQDWLPDILNTTYGWSGDAKIPVKSTQQSSSATQSGAQQSQSTTPQINVVRTPRQSIMMTQCFGLCADVKIYSKDGQYVQYTYDNTTSQGMLHYEKDIYIDKYSKDNFKVGQWYYSAEAIREFADKHHIPVFVEYGSPACGPCVDFHDKVYVNEGFQEFVKSKNILLCRMMADNSSKGDPYYFTHIWTRQGTTEGTYAAGRMPLMLMYYNVANGASNGLGSDGDSPNNVDAIYKKCAHFNDPDDETFPYCPLLSEMSDVSSWIQSCLDEFEWDPSSVGDEFKLPAITEYVGEEYKDWKYKVYQNVDGDNHGTFFPTSNLYPPRRSEQFQITLKNSSGTPTSYSIRHDGVDPVPPDGTYQYFMKNDGQSYNQSQYDLSGLIFKIGQNTTINEVKFSGDGNNTFAYEQKSLQQFLEDNGIQDSDTVDNDYFFNRDIYAQEENDDLEIEYDMNRIDEEVDFDSDPVHNITRTLTMTDGFKIGENDVYKIDLMLSATPATSVDKTDIFKQEGAVEYVMKARFFQKIVSDGSTLLWLSCFNNLQETE